VSSERGSVLLEPGERVAGRDFCDPERTDDDLAKLRRLRAAMRERGESGEGEGRWMARDGCEHWLAAPDWEALARVAPAAAVGFFGQARSEVEHGPIVAAEHDIIARAASFPGLLAYHNARLGECHWGNMVLLASRASVASLAPDPVHIRAVASAPSHYESLRLHRGSLANGLLGEADVCLEETLYLDFSARPTWRGLRVYPRGAEQ
jgi:hypothetical protein